MDDILLRAQDLSERLQAARVAHRSAEHAIARLLAELAADGLFRPLGYTSIEEYTAAKLSLGARQTRDLVRIGRALDGLPGLDAAMRAGELDWTKAREVVRVATPDTEKEWIERARAISSRVLEREVAAAARGERPSDEGVRADAVRMFSVRAESADIEVIRAALSAYVARTGARGDEIDYGAALAAIARGYLAGLEQAGEAEETAEETAEDAAEDAAEAAAEDEPEAETPDRVAGKVKARDGQTRAGRTAPWSRSTPRYRVIVEHCVNCKAARLPEAEISDTVAAEAACDAEVVEMRPGPKQGHVTRTIPPAVRQIVLARARYRCEVPGCRNVLSLDIHHTHQRSDGGNHDPRGLVCLCEGHHRATHAGYLGVERLKDGAVVVFRADGSAAKGPRKPQASLPHVGRGAEHASVPA